MTASWRFLFISTVVLYRSLRKKILHFYPEITTLVLVDDRESTLTRNHPLPFANYVYGQFEKQKGGSPVDIHHFIGSFRETEIPAGNSVDWDKVSAIPDTPGEITLIAVAAFIR